MRNLLPSVLLKIRKNVFFLYLFSYVIVFISAIKQDVDEPLVKKQKIDKADDALEAKIEQQNKEYYKLRDKLESQTKKTVHIAILEANRQAIPEGNSEVSEKNQSDVTLQTNK